MISKTIAAGLFSLAALGASAEAATLSTTFGGADAQASLEVMRPTPVHDYRYGYGYDRDDYRYGYDYRPGRHYVLSPHEVRQILQRRGYRQINYLDRSGSVYRASATDFRGRRVGLVVSARSGAIITAYRI